ncbi:hypothetical protein HYW11_02740 [Candidatus Peregrinibacteria bacterium]|nr:hypothetical protein [Candidatus Peregrinibacteria bacterium]
METAIADRKTNGDLVAASWIAFSVVEMSLSPVPSPAVAGEGGKPPA